MKSGPWILGATLAWVLSACGSQGKQAGTFGKSPSSPLSVQTVYGLDDSATLISMRTDTLGHTQVIGEISGLSSGEFILEISFNPEGQLFGLSNDSRIYKIDLNTSVATPVGAFSFFPGLQGSQFGFSFNPATYELRLTSDAGQNQRISTTTGNTMSVDPNLTYDVSDPNRGRTPNLIAIASSCACGITPTLYGLDSVLKILVRIGSPASVPISPNTGRVFTVGKFDVDLSNSKVALTLPAHQNFGYAAILNTGNTDANIYSFKLDGSEISDLGKVGHTRPIVSWSIVP